MKGEGFSEPPKLTIEIIKGIFKIERRNEVMAFKEYRNMKVCEQSGYQYKPTPVITLKGNWLKECGFNMGTPIIVKCEGDKLTITPAAKSTAQ